MRAPAVLGAALAAGSAATDYSLASAPGGAFWGVGGISGGGATSRLLFGLYPQQQRDEILDFLFKPNFGASVHYLKVEIGGGAQSTEGTEASHAYTADDLSCTRGYEWQLMVEAKKRNPAIKLGGLPWVWPGWVGVDQHSTPWKHPNVTAGYIISWLNCARTTYGLEIDYLGAWNERGYNSA
jgi:galactosylceramidase